MEKCVNKDGDRKRSCRYVKDLGGGRHQSDKVRWRGFISVRECDVENTVMKVHCSCTVRTTYSVTAIKPCYIIPSI